MGSYLNVNEKEYCSKVTSGLMGSMLHATFGAKNETLNGWLLTQDDMAKLFFNMKALKNKEAFDAFKQMFPDCYWVGAINNNPELYVNTVQHICDEFAEILAGMVLDRTHTVLACWV